MIVKKKFVRATPLYPMFAYTDVATLEALIKIPLRMYACYADQLKGTDRHTEQFFASIIRYDHTYTDPKAVEWLFNLIGAILPDRLKPHVVIQRITHEEWLSYFNAQRLFCGATSSERFMQQTTGYSCDLATSEGTAIIWIDRTKVSAEDAYTLLTFARGASENQHCLRYAYELYCSDITVNAEHAYIAAQLCYCDDAGHSILQLQHHTFEGAWPTLWQGYNLKEQWENLPMHDTPWIELLDRMYEVSLKFAPASKSKVGHSHLDQPAITYGVWQDDATYTSWLKYQVDEIPKKYYYPIIPINKPSLTEIMTVLAQQKAA